VIGRVRNPGIASIQWWAESNYAQLPIATANRFVREASSPRPRLSPHIRAVPISVAPTGARLPTYDRLPMRMLASPGHPFSVPYISPTACRKSSARRAAYMSPDVGFPAAMRGHDGLGTAHPAGCANMSAPHGCRGGRCRRIVQSSLHRVRTTARRYDFAQREAQIASVFTGPADPGHLSSKHLIRKEARPSRRPMTAGPCCDVPLRRTAARLLSGRGRPQVAARDPAAAPETLSALGPHEQTRVALSKSDTSRHR